MSTVIDKKDFIHRMTHKGFESQYTGSGHLGLFLLDEQHKRTRVRTGVPLGSHGSKLGMAYIKRMAHHLHIAPKDLILFQACNHSYEWLVSKLREDGFV